MLAINVAVILTSGRTSGWFIASLAFLPVSCMASGEPVLDASGS